MEFVTVFDGTYHFPNALSEQEQKSLLEIYQNSRKEMFVPVLKSGHSMNLNMTCFGKHWSAVDYKYHDARVDYDGKPVEAVPNVLNDIAAKFSKECFPQYLPTWDIAIMNYYKLTNHLGMHRDDSESKETLDEGHPVVSFSIGASCTFRIGGISRKASYVDVELNNGDVILFGGLSRLRYHGITQIRHDIVSPFDDELDMGRVNFTLRKF